MNEGITLIIEPRAHVYDGFAKNHAELFMSFYLFCNLILMAI